MIDTRTSTCATCRHSARGHAIDKWPIRPRVNPTRPSMLGGDYICARTGLTPAKVDPVTGLQGRASGPNCRDLNPDGACEHYRGVKHSNVLIIALGLAMAMAMVAICSH
jgi:hypothetical protein